MPPWRRRRQSARDCTWAARAPPGQAGSGQHRSSQIDLGLDAHARTQLAVAILALIENEFHWNTLDNLDVIARSIFWREHAKQGPRGPGDAVHVGLVSAAVGIDFNFRLLPRLHALELRLFEVGCDPYFAQRDDGEQLLSRLEIQSDDNVLVHLAADRRDDFGVLQIEL